jgi:acetyl-CoA synthetase
MERKTLEVLLQERWILSPPKELVKESNIKRWMDEHGIKSYEELLERAKDLEWFWGEVAKELDWFKPWEKVLDWKPPYAKWFVGGKINIAYNALDRHMATPRENKIAFLWEGETKEERKLTYKKLHEEVNRFANGLKSLGVRKGDRVGIYLPMIPELPISMLACAKIGAVHSVVFSGFSAKALRDRINDANAKVLITADAFFRRGKIVPTKRYADEALKEAPSVEKVIVARRTVHDVDLMKGRDVWWDDLVKGQSKKAKSVETDSEDMLYILYTSGTTGKPKGIIHVHGGYAVGTYWTLKTVFDLKEDDIWWCAADIGWVTGHSYIVYAPLMIGATSVLYEGAPAFPEPDRWWAMIEKYKVTVFYTSPTAIRAHMRLGNEWPLSHDLSSLRLLGSVGEPINPEAWRWYHEVVGRRRCQIMDTWWQTETGNFIISPLPITPLKPGSATKPLPGFSAEVLDEEGKPLTEEGGNLVLLTPWPAMFRGLYKDPERYREIYWSKYPGAYLTGDMARKDEDGYFWIQGRADDVLNVAGHRIGNSEVESALVSHEKVAEAAVIGKPHPIKGESIVAFVVLKEGVEASEELRRELQEHAGEEIGKIAKPDELWFVRDVPKTRSGKIMRRVVRAVAIGNPPGDISTLANPEAVEEIRRAK